MQASALQGVKYYPLDNTAIIHIAVRDKTYSKPQMKGANYDL